MTSVDLMRAAAMPFFQPQLTHGVGRDDGRDVLVADGESHLGDQAADFNVGDAPDELISSTDAPEAAATLLGST